VEDNEDICFLLQALLGRAGYDAAAAKDPAEALEAARREHFDWTRGSGKRAASTSAAR